jgi:hypothetical protein
MSDGQEPAGSKQPAENSYKETAKLTYESLLEMRRLSYAAQADYGKWLISSIFLMHGAGIGGLAFKAGATGAPTYLAAILWFVGGLVLALASGFSAWHNFSFAARQYDDWAKPAMLFDVKKWPTEAPHARGIKLTMRLAICFGFCSVLALAAGSVHIWLVWK